jgi:PAS domain S-box-containing protein
MVSDGKDELERLRRRVAVLEIAQKGHGMDEATIRDGAEVIRALLDSHTEEVLLMDIDGYLLAANESGAKVYGRKPEDIKGVDAFEMLPPELAITRWARVHELSNTGKPLFFKDERNGRRFENRLYPVKDAKGTVTKLVICSRDVTQS